MGGDRFVLGTIMPTELLADFGLVDVRHTQLDHAVNEALRYLAKIDYDIAAAFLGAVQSLSGRLTILSNIIKMKVHDLDEKAKLLTIVEEITRLNRSRNNVAHQLPIASLDGTDGVFMIARTAFSSLPSPEAILVDREHLNKLSTEMHTAQKWLEYPFADANIGGREAVHPDWFDDQKFPWPQQRAKLLSGLQKEASRLARQAEINRAASKRRYRHPNRTGP